MLLQQILWFSSGLFFGLGTMAAIMLSGRPRRRRLAKEATAQPEVPAVRDGSTIPNEADRDMLIDATATILNAFANEKAEDGAIAVQRLTRYVDTLHVELETALLGRKMYRDAAMAATSARDRFREALNHLTYCGHEITSPFMDWRHHLCVRYEGPMMTFETREEAEAMAEELEKRITPIDV